MDASPYFDKPDLDRDEKMEEESLLKGFPDDKSDSKRSIPKVYKRWQKTWSAVNLVLTATNLVFFLFLMLARHNNEEAKPLLPPSPATSVVEKELRPFTLTSPYTRPPGPEVDQMWHDLVNSGAMFTLSPEEFAVLNDNPKTGVKLTHDPEGRYVGTLAATHQIHCVNSLRKGLWFNYKHYMDVHDELFSDNNSPAEHLIHCVEMLRNAVMCSGDVSVITYNWKPGHEAPKANFKSVHSCQKWDKLEEWRTMHNVTGQLQTLERPVGLLDGEPENVFGLAPDSTAN
ncbi:hypothetical protein UA08_01259 [Talaromyces atroroseus]|uniref:Tat pathway signal sequence n=1 Tax=Talaromyces atroroseus TaxID=1441469 RepID=A0A1Q5QB13_TALAT|nr:hypothetical protein UA08_01259 [Talaromyces atroroseus]OKL63125.1 hypothetical protein UA08_01259 [Talaromyces atroroseus]